MLLLRCIMGDLRGGGRVLRSLQRTSLCPGTPRGAEPRCLSGGLPRGAEPRCLSGGLPRGAEPRRLSGGPAPDGPPPPGGISVRARLLVTLLVGGGLLAAWWAVRTEKRGRERRQRAEQLRAVALGRGSFSLLDQRGRRRTKRDFLGQWVLLYFGFTHCPDICPEELAKLSGVVAALERDANAAPLQPLFITVDPDRDDPAALDRYLQDFHPRFVGLTGSPEEVKEAGRDYRVYAAAGPKDQDGDYIVDHTVLIYLLDPDGLFIDYYNRTKTQDQIQDSIRTHMKNYSKT